MSVLLSTVMSHHHHMGRICMVMEQCQEDGNYNDEHTEHHENEQEGCRVHQMHHFVTNAKVVKGLQRLIFDGSHLFFVLSSRYIFIPTQALATVEWQERAASLPSFWLLGISRRGPPCFFF